MYFDGQILPPIRLDDSNDFLSTTEFIETALCEANQREILNNILFTLCFKSYWFAYVNILRSGMLFLCRVDRTATNDFQLHLASAGPRPGRRTTMRMPRKTPSFSY